MRIFGGDRITAIMNKLGIDEGEPIEHGLISRAIENAQSKVEGHNFEIRKQLIEYDDVMNQQREVIYRQRRQILTDKDLSDLFLQMVEDRAWQIHGQFAQEKLHVMEWDLTGLSEAIKKQFNIDMDFTSMDEDHQTSEALGQILEDVSKQAYKAKETILGPDDTRRLESYIMLQTVDSLWKDHLLNMDHLKEGIGLRGYAQQNPLIIYKKEGYEMFEGLVERIKEETLGIFFRIQIAINNEVEPVQQPKQENLVFSHSDDSATKRPVKRAEAKVGRNDPCPCGSGRKHKKCCGV